MNSAVCFVVSYAINAAWQVPLLAAAGFAAARVLRRWGPEAQHRSWVATLLFSSMVPALAAARGFLPLSIASNPGPGASATIAGTATSMTVHTAALFLPAATIWLIFSAYILALAWFAARFLWSIATTAALVREAAPLHLAADGEEIWQRVRRSFPGAEARLLSSKELSGVVTAGLRRPAVILSADFAESWTEDDLLSALSHELAHVLRRDYAKNLLYEAAGLLLAFHPVIQIVKAQIARTREMTCDAMVVERLVDRKRYRQSLLRLAERVAGGRTAQTLGMFDANILEERIMMMKSTRTTPGGLVRIALTGCATLLILAAAIGGTAFAKGVAAATADHNAGPGKIYKIGHGVTAPVLTFAPDAKYTDRARKAHYQGVCVVGLIVGSDGRPRNVHVVHALGMGLDENAVKAANDYRFKPAMFEAKPVPVRINIEVKFRVY